MKNFMKNIIFIFGLFLCVNYNLTAMDRDESSQRNWKSSLDLYHDSDHLYINLDPWFLETKEYINENYSNSIVRAHGKEPTFTNNISQGRMIIFYKNKLNQQQYAVWNLDKIFFSGMTAITDEKLKSFVISAKSSFPAETPLKIVSEAQKNKINNILGSNLLTSGTCAEASMLIYIADNLHEIISKIKDENINNNEFEIIGTLLQISGLKDPCSERCMPMLYGWMKNMHNILNNSISGIKGVNLAGNLENIILLAGRESHKASRKAMIENEGVIKFNLDNPSNKIYSKKND